MTVKTGQQQGQVTHFPAFRSPGLEFLPYPFTEYFKAFLEVFVQMAETPDPSFQAISVPHALGYNLCIYAQSRRGQN